MNKNKFLTLAVIVLFLINIATLAFVFFRKPPPPPKQDGPKKAIIERLHFDDGQVAEYEKLIDGHQRAIVAKQQEMGLAKKALFEQLQQDDPSQKDSLILAIGKLQEEMEDIHFRHFSDVKKLCRPGQMEAFYALTSDLGRYFTKPLQRGKQRK